MRGLRSSAGLVALLVALPPGLLGLFEDTLEPRMSLVPVG